MRARPARLLALEALQRRWQQTGDRTLEGEHGGMRGRVRRRGHQPEGLAVRALTDRHSRPVCTSRSARSVRSRVGQRERPRCKELASDPGQVLLQDRDLAGYHWPFSRTSLPKRPQLTTPAKGAVNPAIGMCVLQVPLLAVGAWVWHQARRRVSLCRWSRPPGPASQVIQSGPAQAHPCRPSDLSTVESANLLCSEGARLLEPEPIEDGPAPVAGGRSEPHVRASSTPPCTGRCRGRNRGRSPG